MYLYLNRDCYYSNMYKYVFAQYSAFQYNYHTAMKRLASIK